MNNTKELVKAYRDQTKKYFDPELMDRDCIICEAVPSYLKSMSDETYSGDTACNDCPLGIPEKDGANYVTCTSHPTYLSEYGRQTAEPKDLLARGEYMIARGELFGMNMDGIKK